MNIARYCFIKGGSLEQPFSSSFRIVFLKDYLSLGDLLRKNSLTMSTNTKLSISLQICRALVYLREQGIVFNNITPESVWIRNRIVKLFDFRFAYHGSFENSDRLWKTYFPYRIYPQLANN